MKKTKLVCEQCGSSKVSVLAWVDANTDKITGEYEQDGKGYCDKCNDSVYLTSISEYRRRRNERQGT